MATEGIEGILVETRDYGATAAFWKSLGYENQFETDHGSGQWVHPAGGPYVFIAEREDGELTMQLSFKVADAATFAPAPPLDLVQPFTPQHWGVLQAVVRDPDGREYGLSAPGDGGHG
jgi:hypothetical protein